MIPRHGNLVFWVDDLMFFFVSKDVCLRLADCPLEPKIELLDKDATQQIAIRLKNLNKI